MLDQETAELLDAVRVGFAGLNVSPVLQERALENLSRWLTEPPFFSWRYQIRALIALKRWDLLLDSFYQVLPFGTGGRRGAGGVGPNRFNPWTLASSVQGHCSWLRRTRGEGPLSVVIAYDVRRFRDLGANLAPGVPNPALDLTSRAFAEIAAEVYAAAGITVIIPPPGAYLSTPELSFAIRFLGADGGLNISASHNPPDDNGSKFYNATGSQEIPPRDAQMAAEVGDIVHIDRMPLDRARVVGLVRELDDEVHRAYIAANVAIAHPGSRSARVLFTNLHGLGLNTVVPVLQGAGFQVTVEPSQAAFDGAFTNVPFRAPNPEVRRSLDAAIHSAEAQGADIVLASDPDADRLGLAARDGDGWRFFSGNEIAALVCDYVAQRSSSPRPIVLKTEVSSGLIDRVARARGATVIGHLLVGFKYIGDALDQLETQGSFAGVVGTLSDFALGCEESHGVLVTPAIRDKDAAGGALMLAELASLEKDRGRTLTDALADLWRAHGYVHNELISTVMRGAEGRARIQAISRSLREDPPTSIGGMPVTAFFDRQDIAGPYGPIQSETDRASRDVLVWHLGERARVILRPSGTEPKNKIYVEIIGETGADLATEIPRVTGATRALAADFTGVMLDRVGIDLPAWALRISDLVSVEHKIHFAREILPALLARVRSGEADPGRWLDIQLSPLGSDGRGLVADAVTRWRETEAKLTEPEAQVFDALFSAW